MFVLQSASTWTALSSTCDPPTQFTTDPTTPPYTHKLVLRLHCTNCFGPCQITHGKGLNTTDRILAQLI